MKLMKMCEDAISIRKFVLLFIFYNFCNEEVCYMCYAKRKKKGKVKQTVVPVIAQVYNQGMGCVDNFDQNMSSVKLKYKNWSWRRMVFLVIMKIIIIEQTN